MGKYDVADDILGTDEVLTAPPVSPAPGKYDIGFDVRTGKPRPTTEEKMAFSAGIHEAITGKRRATELTETLPEFREAELRDFDKRSIGEQLKLTAGLMLTMDEQASKDMIKEAIPQAKFIEDEKGNTIVDIDGELSVLNKPGMSSQDAIRALTQTLAFAPAGRIAQMGKSIMGRFGYGAVGSGITEIGIQETEKIAGAEKERELGRIATSAVLGGAGEAIGPVRQQMALRKYGKEVGAGREELPELAKTISRTGEAGKQVGIDLTLPQRSGSPYALERQAYVASLPTGIKESVDFLKRQNKQSYDAVVEVMRQIAPDIAVVTGPKRARVASDLAIKAQERIRKEAASPLYDIAKANHAPVDTTSLMLDIMERMEKYPKPGAIRKTVSKALDVIADSDDIEQLHYAKIEIDNMLSPATRKLGKEERRELRKIKKDLLRTMEDVSPEYKRARKKFIEKSPAVDEVTAILGEVPDMKDKQLKSLSRRILDPEETNPDVVLKAKKAIRGVDPGAWNELVRVEMERRIGRLRADIKEGADIGATENVPGQLHTALFGTEKLRKVLYAAVDGDTKKNLRYLQTSLKRASTGRPGGSQTAIRKEIIKELRGGFIGSIRDFIVSPIGTTAEAGVEKAFEKRVRSVSKAIFDPAYTPRMKQIRQLGPKSSAAAKAMSQLLNDIDNIEED